MTVTTGDFYEHPLVCCMKGDRNKFDIGDIKQVGALRLSFLIVSSDSVGGESISQAGLVPRDGNGA